MTTALYRRYRPETFADVIGQEHVTEPLMQALRSGRIGHAYLFSGPRGCGKTTSARILARCLNCEQGPTPEPCGVCDSCVALARGGPGSVDVIEIDAASHGGVDDARDLRERASFAPAAARYKVFIIDEAHMVTPAGFNALLKIVEEPPEHVKFIFATTEPEKVIGTIRSRTHHYPFRLVPPARLLAYLEQLCEAEGVAVEQGVLSFVVRAGGGSVRDSLSVLDQLMAGAGEAGLTYERTAALLGFTDGELLDAVVDALAAGDGAAVFTQVDRVVESGHDPRRFVEDLLERLRDLIVVSAMPDGAGAVLRGLPADQLARMEQQAAALGPGQLSHAADIVYAGLAELSGATSPRLQLELICARLLLPAAQGEHGWNARLDRIERRLEFGGEPTGPLGVAGSPRRPTREVAGAPAVAPTSAPTRGQESTPPLAQPGAGDRDDGGAPPVTHGDVSPPADAVDGAQAPASRDGAWQQGPAERSVEQRPAVEDPDLEAARARAAADQQPAAQPRPAAGRPAPGLDAEAVRRAWPDVVEHIKGMSRVAWAVVSQNARVLDFDGERVLLGINNQGLAARFAGSNQAEIVRQAFSERIGLDTRVEGVFDDGSGGQRVEGRASSADGGRPPADSPDRGAPAEGEPGRAVPGGDPGMAALAARPTREDEPTWGSTSAPPPDWASGAPEPADGAAAPAEAPPAARGTDPSPSPSPSPEPAGDPEPAAPPASRLARAVAAARAEQRETSAALPDDDAVSSDDDDVESSGAVGQPVVEAVLGGRVISETTD